MKILKREFGRLDRGGLLAAIAIKHSSGGGRYRQLSKKKGEVIRWRGNLKGLC